MDQHQQIITEVTHKMTLMHLTIKVCGISKEQELHY